MYILIFPSQIWVEKYTLYTAKYGMLKLKIKLGRTEISSLNLLLCVPVFKVWLLVDCWFIVFSIQTLFILVS